MNKKLLSLTAATVLVAGVINTDTASATVRSAKATLTTNLGNRIGTVRFKVTGGHTEVRVSLNSGGLSEVEVDVFHGFHIHANDVDANGSGCVVGDPAKSSTWFTSADGHYGLPGQSHPHHVGDMPVVYFNSDGGVETRFRLDQIHLADIVGKVVILHAGPDNYNNIPLGEGDAKYKANSDTATTATAKTGNAGDRIACGVITP